VSHIIGPHRLHSILLARAQDAPSLEDANKDLLLLHAVLVARIAKRRGEGYAPSENEIYRELERMLYETK
jgi:hypothetical protein